MNKRVFGSLPTGQTVELYELRSDELTARIMTYGAAIVDVIYDGVNIIGGFDTLEDYLEDTSHQGALIGRVANRVAGAAFQMDGVTYRLPDNDGGNCLHGGEGFDRRLFRVTQASDTSLTLTYRSEDGEEGFPSALTVCVTYTLSGSRLIIDYKATPEGKTPIALTNHAYFNLDGMGGTVHRHTVTVDADTYTEVDGALIPTGRRPDVTSTVFDLRAPRTVGDALSDEFSGYDHNYVLNRTEVRDVAGRPLALAATVTSGSRTLRVYTDQPCMQLYIGNFLEGTPDFRGGVRRVKHGALCLETQTEPNCINRAEAFYDKGEVYHHTTVYELSRHTV